MKYRIYRINTSDIPIKSLYRVGFIIENTDGWRSDKPDSAIKRLYEIQYYPDTDPGYIHFDYTINPEDGKSLVSGFVIRLIVSKTYEEAKEHAEAYIAQENGRGRWEECEC